MQQAFPDSNDLPWRLIRHAHNKNAAIRIAGARAADACRGIGYG